MLSDEDRIVVSNLWFYNPVEEFSALAEDETQVLVYAWHLTAPDRLFEGMSGHPGSPTHYYLVIVTPDESVEALHVYTEAQRAEFERQLNYYRGRRYAETAISFNGELYER